MRMLHRAFVVTVLAAAALSPLSLRAQGVTYRSTTKIDAAGALGALVRMGAKAGGAGEGMTTYVEGHKMATDAKSGGTIIDADAGRFITINRRDKSYSSVTFEELAQSLAAANAEAAAQKGKQEKAAPESQMDYTLAVDRTSERQQIAGYNAQRQFITLTMKPKATDKEAKTEQGNLVVLLDVWTTTEGPLASATREFQKAYAAKARAEMQSSLRGLEAMFGSDPAAKSALQAAGKELAKVQGVQLRSTTYIVSVPPTMKFDRAALVAGADKAAAAEAAAPKPEEKPKGGFMSRMKAAAQKVQQAQNQEGEAGPPAQKTVISFTTEVQDIQSGVPADAFSIPAGFKEVKPKY